MSSELDRKQAEQMLEQLRAYYREPVMPLSRFCSGLRKWGEAMLKGGPKGAAYKDLGSMVLQVVGSASKSNLLFRIFFLGEDPRERPCPVHQGRWSGCFQSDCGCMSGSNVTGWLPDDDEPIDASKHTSGTTQKAETGGVRDD